MKQLMGIVLAGAMTLSLPAQAQDALIRDIVESVGRSVLEDNRARRLDEQRRREEERRRREWERQRERQHSSTPDYQRGRTASQSRREPAARIVPQPRPVREPARRSSSSESRETVASIQSMLNRLGFKAGPVDGLMGSKTRNAIRRFQSSRGLSATGIPSASLVLALHSAMDSAENHDAVEAPMSEPVSGDAKNLRRAEASPDKPEEVPANDGRTRLPYPFDDKPSSDAERADFERRKALQKRMSHAWIAASPQALDDDVTLLRVAWDYMTPEQTRDFLCSAEEMKRRASGCMELDQAEGKAELAMPQAYLQQKKQRRFSWWRGANEFERRRTIEAFRDSQLVHEFLANAPDPPFKFTYVLQGRLGPYDFDKAGFPLNIRGVNDTLRSPWSHIRKISLNKMKSFFPVAESRAENFRQKVVALSEDESPDISVLVNVDADIQTADEKAQWKETVGAIRYQAGSADSAVLLSELAGRPTSSNKTEAGDSQAAFAGTAATKNGFLRQFDLPAPQDGRVVFPFGNAEVVAYLESSGLSGIRDLPYPIRSAPFIRDILRPELRDQYLPCYDRHNYRCIRQYKRFAGETEFDARRNRAAVVDTVIPALIKEVPQLPIEVRQLSTIRLGEYNFDKQQFAIRHIRSDMPRTALIEWRKTLGMVPEHLAVSPDRAEAMLQKMTSRELTLQLDYRIDTLTLDLRADPAMTFTPQSMTLLTADESSRLVHEQTLPLANEAVEER